MIANRFCDYFTNLGVSLANEIPTTFVSPCFFLTGNYVNSMFLEPISQSEVIDVVKSLRSGSAVGHDKIPMWIVKNSIGLISEPLCNLINFSITTGIVPKQMKIARVLPIFKSGDDRLFSNYRPISVLPIFSKILAKVVYTRRMSYIYLNDILTKNQYGFRKKHSKSLALISYYDKMSSSLDANKYTVGILIS